MGATFYFAREALLRALKTGQTRFFCQPVKRRRMCFESTSSPLHVWSTSTCQATRLSSATTAQS
ncbi:hypothetical protein Q8W43_20535 [Klebsiella pneumoniae]|nr:hypothetical protein Q8W43_20535 [Klebsiella pneumoniae]